MDIKITELKEKFIIYYESDNIVHLCSTPHNSITTDEFMKYNIPCKDCLVQSMCLNRLDDIGPITINSGIKIQLCEKMKKFIGKNKPLFNRVTIG